MKIKQIQMDTRLWDVLFQEATTTDKLELGVDFGYLSPHLYRQVLHRRVQEAFIEWLKVYERDAESKVEKQLTRRLQRVESLEELEHQIFCGPVIFHGEEVSSLQETVVGEAYLHIFQREKSDMQLPVRLSDERLDAFVEDLFYSQTPKPSDEKSFFVTRRLLRNLIDESYLSRCLAKHELDTLLLYLFGNTASEAKENKLQSRLERIYQLLIQTRLVETKFHKLVARIYELPSTICELETWHTKARLELEELHTTHDQLKDQFLMDSKQKRAEIEDSSSPLDGLVQRAEGFEKLKAKLSPPVEREVNVSNPLDDAEQRLRAAQLLAQQHQDELKEKINQLIGDIQGLINEIPDVLRQRRKFPELRRLEDLVANTSPAINEIIGVLEKEECREEIEQLGLYVSRFALKPLELLFFIRFDELRLKGKSRFDALSLSYIAVMYDFIRVELFVDMQQSLNRFFAAEYERDDYPVRHVSLHNVLRALSELEPMVAPFVDDSTLSVRRSRYVVDSYELSFVGLVELFEAMLLVAGGFFEKDEGRFVYVRQGKAFLNTSLHSLLFLVCEWKAGDFVEQVRSKLMDCSDLLEAAFKSLDFAHGIQNPKDAISPSLPIRLKEVMGFSGGSLVASATPAELRETSNNAQRAAYTLHPSKRWRVWSNAFVSVASSFSSFIGSKLFVVCRVVFVGIPTVFATGASHGVQKSGYGLARLLLRLFDIWKNFWQGLVGSWVKFFILLIFAWLFLKTLLSGQWFWSQWGLSGERTVIGFLLAICRGLGNDLRELLNGC